jgi:hypothetical protein
MAENKGRGQARKRNLVLRIALYTGGVLGGLVVLVLLINLHDPDLDPRAVALMRATPSPVPDADNAYFVLYGLGVAQGQDPHAHGIRFVAMNNVWMQSQDAGQPSDRRDVEAMANQNKAVPWRGATKDLCGKQREDCFATYSRHRPQIEELVRDNKLRLARYRSLYRYKHFRETMLNRVGSWPPHLAGAEHETVLAQITLNALDGRVDGSLRELVTDTAYWRRVLAGASTLVSKSVASSILSRNYALASEIIARYPDRPNIGDHLVEMSRSLTSEEKDWKGVFASEFQWVVYMYASLRNHDGERGLFNDERRPWDRLLLKMFYSPNATINLQNGYSEKLQALADKPAHALADIARQVDNDFGEITNAFRADMVYNPVGKILAAIGAQSPQRYARYIARTHNLDGSVRLLRVQLDINRKKVAAKNIGLYLERSSVDLLDPYRSKPFRWDYSRRELWFEGIDPKSEGLLTADQRIAVRI